MYRRSNLFALASALALALAAPAARADEPPDSSDAEEMDLPSGPKASPGIQPSPAAPTPPAPANASDAASAQAPEPAVHHRPLASARAEEPLTVSVEVISAHRLSEVTLQYRRSGERQYRSVPFARARTAAWVATVPAEHLGVGVIEYFIASRAAGAPPDAPVRLHFASPEAPHRVLVIGDDARTRADLLAVHMGNRSRVQLQSEYVDFGARDVVQPGGSTASMRDRYYRIEGDYTYRILGIVHSIRLGAGLIRGDTYDLARNEQGMLQRVLPNHRIGLDYGFAELRFRFARLLRVDVRVTLGAGPQQFEGGAGGQLIIGHDPGTHFAIGGDVVSAIGARGWLRLAWNTVPRVPMSLTLEITTLPDNNDISGRVYLGFGYRFNRHFSMNANIGYATRDFGIGGPGAGLGAALEF